jgi:hypothetical protein
MHGATIKIMCILPFKSKHKRLRVDGAFCLTIYNTKTKLLIAGDESTMF